MPEILTEFTCEVYDGMICRAAPDEAYTQRIIVQRGMSPYCIAPKRGCKEGCERYEEWKKRKK